MVSICFINDPDENSQMQWDYILLNFRPDNLYIISEENLEFNRKSPRSKSTVIKSVKDLPKNVPLVVLAPKISEHLQGETSLLEFKHPKDAIYFFGSDNGQLSKEDFKSRKPEHLVYVPVDTDDQMFSFMAAAVVLWDRRVKNG